MVTRTTTRKKPTAKTTATTAKKPAVKASAAKAAQPGVQGVTQPEVPAMRKKQLIDTVVTRSGIKKKYAKPVVEAMLEVLGEAIASGKEMNLQPFGKVMMKRQIDKPNALISNVKIRQSKKTQAPAPKDPVVQAAE